MPANPEFKSFGKLIQQVQYIMIMMMMMIIIIIIITDEERL